MMSLRGARALHPTDEAPTSHCSTHTPSVSHPVTTITMITMRIIAACLATCCALLAAAAAAAPTDNAQEAKAMRAALATLTDRETRLMQFVAARLVHYQLKCPANEQADQELNALRQLKLETQADLPLEAIVDALEKFDKPVWQLRNFSMARVAFNKHLVEPCKSVHAKLQHAAQAYASIVGESPQPFAPVCEVTAADDGDQSEAASEATPQLDTSAQAPSGQDLASGDLYVGVVYEQVCKHIVDSVDLSAPSSDVVGNVFMRLVSKVMGL